MASVEDIIEQSLQIAAELSSQSVDFANQAVTASSGATFVTVPTLNFTPKSGLEPNVFIPTNASGVDSALYSSVYDQIRDDLAGKFAEFFTIYFPNECDYLSAAQGTLCEMLAGGSGIPAHVEDQIWQRDRARVLSEVNRANDEIMAGFAGRGFPLPPGAAQHQMNLAQQDAQARVSQQSRDIAIKHVDILIENIKFAVQQALDYRLKSIAAAADYIKVFALGPEIAMRMATSAAGAQAQLINAASSYYRNRIAVEELKLEVAKYNTSMKHETNLTAVREFAEQLKARSQVLASAANAMGNMASSALNSLHASVQKMVQEESA